MIKESVRNKHLKLRNELKNELVSQKSTIILNKIITSPLYKNCNQIFTYASKDNEVDTINLILRALKDNKKVAVPKIYKGNNMKYYYINNIDKDLRTGKFSVLEPVKTMDEATGDLSTLFIVPAVGVSKDKNRIGYGGGYFDRYFNQHKILSKKMCIVYDFQIIDEFEEECHDVKLDHVVSEKNFF